MKGFSLASTFTRSSLAPWTCRRCTLQGKGHKPFRGYSTGGNYTYEGATRPKRKGRVLMAAAGTAGLVGVTAVTYQDQVKHGYQAMERTGRVASTLALCINE